MYISSINIQNFRCFDDRRHTINFNPGLTVLVGENDSGKTAVLDAIKIVLGTTDFGWNRITINDFYNEDQSKEIHITCHFTDLTPSEQAAFLECLTYREINGVILPQLYLHWTCKYSPSFAPPRPISALATGFDGSGPAPSSEAKEMLRVTYLRALRDTYSDMQAGRNSRLSQIMQNISHLSDGIDEYRPDVKLEDLSLTGIVNLSNHLLLSHNALQTASQSMTDILSSQMLLKKDSISTQFEVAGATSNNQQKVIALLEKLDLAVNKDTSHLYGNVGLGTSNIISMACELLLHKEAEAANRSSFLLIEEPEAHIHAQRQLKLVQSLQDSANKKHQQIILTTHSPLLASVVKLSNLVIIKEGKVFPMAEGFTNLEKDDYWFLEKYLDATKANLFFARSVLIVEGPGEALLIPTLAKLLNRSFTDFGTSVVDVRGTGLRRYAKIFQRTDSSCLLEIKVACVTDRDIMPNCAPGICIKKEYTTDKSSWPDASDRKWRAEADFSPKESSDYEIAKLQKADGQFVKTFLSNHWTLEYDLAYWGFKDTTMRDVLIRSLIKVTYEPINWVSKTTEFKDKLNNYSTFEEKASFFYSYFTYQKASKADFSQRLAFELSEEYKNKSDELKKALPPYLVQAIEYVTED